VRGEVLAGEHHTSPSALPKHSRAARALGSVIGKPCVLPHLWLLGPSQRVLESFELSGDTWRRTVSYDTAVAHIKPFEHIALEVAVLFPPKCMGLYRWAALSAAASAS